MQDKLGFRKCTKQDDWELVCRKEFNKQVHLALGWKKVDWPDDGKHDVIGSPGGWCWESPDGVHYDGNYLSVPDYLANIEDSVKFLQEMTKIVPALDDYNKLKLSDEAKAFLDLLGKSILAIEKKKSCGPSCKCVQGKQCDCGGKCNGNCKCK
jgi:hypothetical protein